MLILWLIPLIAAQARAFTFMTAVPQQQPDSVSASIYVSPERYDPGRDPEKDLAAAAAEAEASHRNIFVVVGGEWCSWCHILDRFFHNHPDLASLRDKNYVLMKVSMSQENPNRPFLSRYPKIHGYPHIFILNSRGQLIRSQPTNELEDGRSYNLKHFEQFLEKFAPESSQNAK